MTQRGCGMREEGGMYVCVDTSPFGKPIEFFIVDPALPFQQDVNLRAPFLLRDSNRVAHLILGIGKSFYPFFSDFVEEARRMGVSKRIPKGYNLSALDPERSSLVLVHPRAIPEFDYDLRREWCPRKVSGRKDPGPHECVGDLWDLSSVRSEKYQNVVRHLVQVDENSEWLKISTPSCSYQVMGAFELNGERMTKIYNYHRGIVMRFPRFHFEYVSREGEAPSEIDKVLTDLGYEFRVLEE